MVTKLFMRKSIDKFSITKQYFLRGHNSWFSLFFSLTNFTIIFFKLLLENLSFVPEFLKSYLVFVIIFSLIYFPLSTIIGYLDFKKGTFSAEQTLQKEISPVWQELFFKIDRLEEENQKLLELVSTLKE